jgi:hypothetical protein
MDRFRIGDQYRAAGGDFTKFNDVGGRPPLPQNTPGRHLGREDAHRGSRSLRFAREKKMTVSVRGASRRARAKKKNAGTIRFRQRAAVPSNGGGRAHEREGGGGGGGDDGMRARGSAPGGGCIVLFGRHRKNERRTGIPPPVPTVQRRPTTRSPPSRRRAGVRHAGRVRDFVRVGWACRFVEGASWWSARASIDRGEGKSKGSTWWDDMGRKRGPSRFAHHGRVHRSTGRRKRDIGSWRVPPLPFLGS